MKNENGKWLRVDAGSGCALFLIGGAILALGLVVLLGAETASPLVLRRAAEVPNGGLASASVLDGTNVVERFNDGTVRTNALRFANTPPADRPQIESELQKALIVSAARSRNEGSLSLAVEEARVVLLEAREAREVPVLPKEPPPQDDGIVQPPARDR